MISVRTHKKLKVPQHYVLGYPKNTETVAFGSIALILCFFRISDQTNKELKVPQHICLGYVKNTGTVTFGSIA